MKRLLVIPVAVVLLLLPACSISMDNSVTVRNTASESVHLNFLGKVISLKPNASVVIKNVDKGTYNYVTSFDIPASVNTASSEGSGSGQLEIGIGTRVSIFYSSRIQVSTSGGASGAQSTYVLITTVSSSDKVNSSSTGSGTP